MYLYQYAITTALLASPVDPIGPFCTNNAQSVEVDIVGASVVLGIIQTYNRRS